MRPSALHCTALHYTALHCRGAVGGQRLRKAKAGDAPPDIIQTSKMPPDTLHCTALHCTALHCQAPGKGWETPCCIVYGMRLVTNPTISIHFPSVRPSVRQKFVLYDQKEIAPTEEIRLDLHIDRSRGDRPKVIRKPSHKLLCGRAGL
jgi:hypothetical protein